MVESLEDEKPPQRRTDKSTYKQSRVRPTKYQNLLLTGIRTVILVVLIFLPSYVADALLIIAISIPVSSLPPLW